MHFYQFFKIVSQQLLMLMMTVIIVDATYSEKDLVQCDDFDDCRAACGPSASHYKCHSSGYCSCLNLVVCILENWFLLYRLILTFFSIHFKGHPSECERLNENDTTCAKMCGNERIPKRCKTVAGYFCTCYQHPFLHHK